MEETIEKINYKNKQYIFVNDDMINGKHIYHFINTEMIDFLTDDEKFNSIDEENIPIFSLFLLKDKNNYTEIKNKTEIHKLLKHFGMMPEYMVLSIISGMALGTGIYMGYKKLYMQTRKVEDAKREEYINEQRENFKKIKEKLGIDIDLNKIEKKLNNIKLNEFKTFSNGIAFYNPIENSVNIPENTPLPKQTKLHETIHYLAGRKYSFANMFSKFLLEGATENLVIDYFGNNTSKTNFVRNKNNPKIKNEINAAQIKYNFSTGTNYQPFISLVKQLEYVTGEKSYESAINGNNHFVKSIAKELGAIATIKLFAQTNFLLEKTKTDFSQETDVIKMQQKLQDMILKISFDKKFRKINSIDDAKDYLEQLRGFETYRSKITYLKANGDIQEDDTYKRYYNEKYQELKNRFYEDKEILKGYEYQEQKYNDREYEVDIKGRVLSELSARQNIEDIPHNIKYYKTAQNSYLVDRSINKLPSNILIISGQESFIMESIKIKNPNMSEDEYLKAFLEQTGAEKIEGEITFSEDEIKEKYEQRLRIQQKFSELQSLKKVTFIDKIKRKMHNLFSRNKTSKENVKNEKDVSDSNSPQMKPWDLNNWGEGTKESVLKKQEQILKTFSEESQQKGNTRPKESEEQMR